MLKVKKKEREDTIKNLNQIKLLTLIKKEDLGLIDMKEGLVLTLRSLKVVN